MPTTNRLRALIAGATLVAALALPMGFAAAAGSDLMGSTLGKTAAEVSTNLKSMGFEVRRLENEDGMIEGYALKDGKRYEVYVDPATGKVARFEEKN